LGFDFKQKRKEGTRKEGTRKEGTRKEGMRKEGKSIPYNYKGFFTCETIVR